MAFKVLHCLLLFLRRSFCLEDAQISSLARLRIFLVGIQPIVPGFQLPDHAPLNIRARSRVHALNCGQTPSAFAVTEFKRQAAASAEATAYQGAAALHLSGQTIRKPKCKQRGEDSEIGRKVRRETPVLAGVTETTTGDIEPAHFCRGDRERKDHVQDA